MNIQNAIDYLKSSPEMVFDIYDVPGKERTHTNLSFFEEQRIINDPFAFFESLLNLYGEIQIQLKQTKGASTKNPQPTITLKKEEIQPIIPQKHSSGLHAQHSLYDNSFGTMPAGLNAAVFSDMVNARTLGDKVEGLQQLYDTEKELRQRIDSELQALRIANGALQTKYDTLELKKELEKDRALLEQKGGLGQFIEKVNPDKILGLAEVFIQSKVGNANAAEGLEGLGLPEYKMDFVELIQEEEITEEHIDLLSKIAQNMVQVTGFYAGLLNMLTPKTQSNQVQEPSDNTSNTDFDEEEDDESSL